MLRRANEALQASEARFRALVQNSSDIISLFDAEGTVVYQSASIVRLLGYRPQDDSEEYAAETLAREKPSGDPIAEAHQGGLFCTAEEVPNPAAPQKKAKKKK